jgi:import inner membrane translocase subunit TIM44
LQVQEGEDGKESLGSKLKEKIANRLNQTETMKQVKSSEEFKEYSTFKAEMKQFKEDVKERVQNHPSNVVQGSIYLYVNGFAEVLFTCRK